jgi:hypothetical protein
MLVRLPRPRPLPLPLPTTDSVELGGGLRYEGLWVEGRWVWSLWYQGELIYLDAQRRLGSREVS